MQEPENNKASASEASAPEADATLSPAEREEARLQEPDVSNAVAEAARRSGALESTPAKRPPIWLIIFTLSIPLAIGWVWYQSSNMRPLTCSEIEAKLSSGNAAEHRHALEWAGKLIDEYNQAGLIEAVRRDEEEVVPCAKTVLEYSAKTPPEDKLYNDLCRALGSFQALKNQEFRKAAFDYLFDVVSKAHPAGQHKYARYQAATSLARFGRTYLRQEQVLQPVQEVVGQMLSENDELTNINGVYAMTMIGTHTHAQQLRTLAKQTNFPNVKTLAEDAAAICQERVE